MKVKTEFKFTLPNGSGIKAEPGRKVSGVMELIKVKDLLSIAGDSSVKQGSGLFLVVLLSLVIKQIGTERSVNRSTIERLSPTDFYFLVDFMHQINHQVLKHVSMKCTSCNHEYEGVFAQLGEV